ncbi:MAG: septum formation family protein [Microbacterium enclense]
MPEPLELHLTLPAGPARDAVATALSEQGFTVNATATGSLDVSRGSLGTTLVAGAFAGQDMHVRFDVHVRDTPEGAVAEFVHSAAGGFFKGGAVGAVKAGDVVREAAHLAGVRLAQQGLIVGAVPVPPAPAADAGVAPTPGMAPTPGAAPSEGVPAYAGAASIPPPVDYANRTNVVAIFAIVLGFLVPIGGIIAGAIGLAQVKRTGEKGRGLAITGIVVGSVMTVLGTIAVIAFIALVVVGGAAREAANPGDGGVFDPNGGAPSQVLSLQVGECLDDVSTGIITTDNLVDCDSPHTYEVFGDVAVPDGAFPGESAIDTTAQRSCDEAFASYVGVPYDESTLDYSYVGPSSDTWDLGDRQIACLLTDPAGETTGSLANSGR